MSETHPENPLKTRRKLWRWIAAAVAVLVTLGLAFVALAWFLIWGDPEWRFVEDVLLSGENGGGRVVKRWIRPPKMALVDASAEDDIYVRKVVFVFNGIMATSGVTLEFATVEAADIVVYFTPKETFRAMAGEFGGNLDEPATGYYSFKPSENFEINRAIALIGSELAGDERRATIIHELAHVMGLRNHSSEFADSVVYESGESVSTAIRLSPNDRELLKLVYGHLEPGDLWRETRRAFEAHWRP